MDTTPVAAVYDATALADVLFQLLDARAFFLNEWEREQLHLPAVFDAEQLEAIFPLHRFDEVLSSGGLMAPHLDIVQGSRKHPAPFRMSPSPATDVERVLAGFADGSTVRVAHVEHYLPSVAAFCRGMERRLHMPLRANLYMTPAFSQGFSPHYDLDDIFVVQAFGRKQWLLHPAYTGQQSLPNADMAFDGVRHVPAGDATRVDLSAGDVLYLPRGFMHEARTDAHPSIHITFAVIGLKLGQFVEQLVKQLALVEPGLRRTIAHPPGNPPDQEQLLALAGELRVHLERLLAPERLAAGLDSIANYMARHRNPELRGRLLDLLSGTGAPD